jgi:hypothetical protein
MSAYEHMAVRLGLRSDRWSSLSMHTTHSSRDHLMHGSRLAATPSRSHEPDHGKAQRPSVATLIAAGVRPGIAADSNTTTHQERTTRMSEYKTSTEYALSEDDRTSVVNAGASGVSWAAIFVGAAAAAALSLVLLILGFGLSLSAVSPWSNSGASAKTMGISTIVWLAFTQIAASAIGGYLAGRLRVKWARLHTDEVYFRDTAHGFMAWAVASLGTAALLGSAVTGILSSGLHADATLAGGVAAGTATVAAAAANSDAIADIHLGYYIDSLFRKDAAHLATPTNPVTRVEALKIFANDIRVGTLPEEDKQYLGGVIAQETGVAQSDGEKRASDKFAQLQKATGDAENSAKQAVDSARKAAAHSSLWMFVALLLGAFSASLAATFGGRQRDSRA